MRTTTLFLFVYMQISKWGWPTEQNVVGGHGKHIMALACNDTLSVCVCVWYLKIACMRAQRGMWKHYTLVSHITCACLSLSLFSTALH